MFKKPNRIQIKFEKRDLWIGVFWDARHLHMSDAEWGRESLRLYICLVPCFPIILAWD